MKGTHHLRHFFNTPTEWIKPPFSAGIKPSLQPTPRTETVLLADLHPHGRRGGGSAAWGLVSANRTMGSRRAAAKGMEERTRQDAKETGQRRQCEHSRQGFIWGISPVDSHHLRRCRCSSHSPPYRTAAASGPAKQRQENSSLESRGQTAEVDLKPPNCLAPL